MRASVRARRASSASGVVVQVGRARASLPGGSGSGRARRRARARWCNLPMRAPPVRSYAHIAVPRTRASLRGTGSRRRVSTGRRKGSTRPGGARSLTQPLAFGECFVDEPEVALLQVAQAAVDHLRRLRRRARREVVPLDEAHPQAARGGVERDAAPGDPTADDQHVERLVLHAGDRRGAVEPTLCGHRVPTGWFRSWCIGATCMVRNGTTEHPRRTDRARARRPSWPRSNRPAGGCCDHGRSRSLPDSRRSGDGSCVVGRLPRLDFTWASRDE